MSFEKILITAPTSAAKAYCLEDWLDNELKTVYPNFMIGLFDNTLDNGESAAYQNNYYKKKYGGDQFLCLRSDVTGCDGVISRICKSHNDCRDYALENKYDAIWHLETDVFPKPHFLQELVLNKKPVCGGLYYRDEGRFRRLMIQQRVYRSPHNIFSKNATPEEDLYFIDGTLKTASHIGLGCVLIRSTVLKKIPFRYVPGLPAHTDSYWAEDCFKHKIKIWADTNLICEHRNSNWLIDIYSNTNKA